MAEYDEFVRRLKDAAYGDHERGCPARSSPACICGWDASAQMATEEAAAAIKALQERGQWQDISTAPKDGTTFLAYNSFSGTYTTCFTTMWIDGSPDYEGFPCGFVNGMFGAWDVQPSHWQPLPPPPTT